MFLTFEGCKTKYTIIEFVVFGIEIILYIKIEAKIIKCTNLYGDNFNGWAKWSLLKLLDIAGQFLLEKSVPALAHRADFRPNICQNYHFLIEME